MVFPLKKLKIGYKMKRRCLQILFLVLFLFGMFSCKDTTVETGSLLPARFELPFNNATAQRGASIRVEIALAAPEKITDLKIYTKDTLIFDGLFKEKSKLFVVNTKNWTIGTNQITLEVKTKDGKTNRYHRIVKIIPNVFPEIFRAEVLNVYPHNTSSYTQGLEFDENQLYESTGGRGSIGKSLIAKVDLQTGKFLQEHKIGDQYFGEGITIIGDTLYQLTWQKHTCFIYDKNTFEKIGTYTYTGEGWGLTNNGEELIMSDGSNRIYFRDPNTFGLLRTIEVYNNEGPVDRLNELEYIHGEIYANVYTTNKIVVIDPHTGIVIRKIDASLVALDYRKTGEVLNGIAYNKNTKQLFITGKDWPNLLEIGLAAE